MEPSLAGRRRSACPHFSPRRAACRFRLHALCTSLPKAVPTPRDERLADHVKADGTGHVVDVATDARENSTVRTRASALAPAVVPGGEDGGHTTGSPCRSPNLSPSRLTWWRSAPQTRPWTPVPVWCPRSCGRRRHYPARRVWTGPPALPQEATATAGADVPRRLHQRQRHRCRWLADPRAPDPPRAWHGSLGWDRPATAQPPGPCRV